MGYRLWMGTFDDVLKGYYNEDSSILGQFDMFGGENTSLALPLYIKGKNVFSIEDIDFITAGSKDDNEFLSMLRIYNSLDSNIHGSILMTYNYDGLKEKEIVYNSPLLKKYASEVRDKKRQGYTDNEIWLSRSEELLEFAKRFTRYIKTERLTGEILNLSLPTSLKRGISSYAKSCKTGDEREEKKGFTAIYTGCLKYSNLRKLIVWEQKHLLLEKEKRILSSLKATRTKEMKSEMLSSIGKRRTLTVKPLTSKVVSQIYNIQDSSGDIDWDRVWSEYSADDVYKSVNFDDLQSIGFFDINETKESLGFTMKKDANLVKKK